MGHMMTDEADERSSTKEEAMRRALGRRIVEIRRRQGMSQAELARRLGVESCRLSHWERGSHQPSLWQVAELAAALEAGLEELILGQAPAQSGEVRFTRSQWDRFKVCLRTAMEVIRTEEPNERRTRAAPGAAVRKKSGSPRQSR